MKFLCENKHDKQKKIVIGIWSGFAPVTHLCLLQKPAVLAASARRGLRTAAASAAARSGQ